MESPEGSADSRHHAVRERIAAAREHAQRRAVAVGRYAFAGLWVPFLALYVVSWPGGLNASETVIGSTLLVLETLAFVGGGYAWRRAPFSRPWEGIAACLLGGLLLGPTAVILLADLAGYFG